ncbi:hypothetical protein D3C87_2131930 [compost metagenome]
MQRISVDLPLPEGPQSTIFSPFATDMLILSRALKAPYHFSTPDREIIGSVVVALFIVWFIHKTPDFSTGTA